MGIGFVTALDMKPKMNPIRKPIRFVNGLSYGVADILLK